MVLSSLRFGVVIVTNFPTLTWKGLLALYMSVGSKKTEKDINLNIIDMLHKENCFMCAKDFVQFNIF